MTAGHGPAVHIGFDIGGTKIAGAAFGPDHTLRAEVRAQTPRDFAGTVDCLVELTGDLCRQAGQTPSTVGISMPGQITRAGDILSCVNLTWLVGQPLLATLSERLGLPVAIANDGNCFALSEAVDGAGRGAPVVFGITLGTGVGAGIVVERRIVTGANALSGEWGHTRFPFDPARDPAPAACGCGQTGCIEPILRGRALLDEYVRLGGTDAASSPDVIARSDADDVAQRAVANYCDRLARALTDVVHLLDPDVIVIGGGLSHLPALYEQVSPALASYALGNIANTRLRAAQFGADSGVRGAAWLQPAPA